MNACGQSGGPLGSPVGSICFLPLLATQLCGGLYPDTIPLVTHCGMGHEPLPRGEVRVREVPGTLSQWKCRRMWGALALPTHRLDKPPSYSLDPDFIFFPSKNEEYGT